MKILNIIWVHIINTKTMKMILKNIIEFFIIGFIILTIVFFLVNSVPGATSLDNITNVEAKKAIQAKYHLSGPLIERYGYYLKGLIHGDLGVSTSFMPGAEINTFIWKRFAISLTIGIIALAITLGLGIPLGLLVGMSKNKIVDTSATFVTSILISVPAIIFAIFLLIFAKNMGLPYVYDSANFVTWVLPALSLGLSPMVVYMRYIRTEMNSEMSSMHAKFAYLKGASRMRFVWRHALKPSLFPVITFLPFSVLTVFLGGMFTERFFQVPGSGGLMFSAITTHDTNIIAFLILLNALITILGYSIRDILYHVLDPRVGRK